MKANVDVRFKQTLELYNTMDSTVSQLNDAADDNKRPAITSAPTLEDAVYIAGYNGYKAEVMAACFLSKAFHSSRNILESVIRTEALKPTLLMFAAKKGNVDRCRLLLSLGATVDAYTCNEGGGTALSFAARHGHLQVVQILVAAGATVRPHCTHHFTPPLPLTAAIHSRSLPVVQFLLANGASVAGYAEATSPEHAPPTIDRHLFLQAAISALWPEGLRCLMDQPGALPVVLAAKDRLFTCLFQSKELTSAEAHAHGESILDMLLAVAQPSNFVTGDVLFIASSFLPVLWLLLRGVVSAETLLQNSSSITSSMFRGILTTGLSVPHALGMLRAEVSAQQWQTLCATWRGEILAAGDEALWATTGLTLEQMGFGVGTSFVSAHQQYLSRSFTDPLLALIGGCSRPAYAYWALCTLLKMGHTGFTSRDITLLLHHADRQGVTLDFLQPFVPLPGQPVDDVRGWPALGIACTHTDTLELLPLARAKTNVNVVWHGPKEGKYSHRTGKLCPLMVAVVSRSADAVQLLVDSGADMFAMTQDVGDQAPYPLVAAVESANVEVVQALLSNWKKCVEEDVDGKTYSSARHACYPTTTVSGLSTGYKVNKATLVCMAVVADSLEMVKDLYDAGMSVSHASDSGVRPLMVAKTAEMVDLLVSLGASVEHKDDAGNDAGDFFAWRGYTEAAAAYSVHVAQYRMSRNNSVAYGTRRQVMSAIQRLSVKQQGTESLVFGVGALVGQAVQSLTATSTLLKDSEAYTASRLSALENRLSSIEGMLGVIAGSLQALAAASSPAAGVGK